MSKDSEAALLLWDAFVTFSIIPSTFFVTYQAVFNASVAWQWPVIYAGDVIFITSLATSFFRQYTDSRGTSFFLNLVSIIPLEVAAVVGNLDDLNYIVAVLRCNRVLRLYHVWLFLYNQEKRLGTNTILLMGVRFLFMGAVTVHCIAGIWFAAACTNKSLVGKGEVCDKQSWAGHQDIDWKVASELKKYIVALYWSVTTVTTVGYGDITPKTTLEKWVAVVCMLWGVVLFGYILGELASMLTNADAQRTCYIHRLNAIKEQLSDYRVSRALKNRVVNYYEYLWKRNKGKSVIDLLDQLPLALEAEVSLESYKTLLEKSTLFKGSPEGFLRMLSLNVKPVLYLPHQIIVNKGAVSTDMYIVQVGEAEVMTERRLPPVAVLKEGDIFGERNMVQNIPSTKLLRARTHLNMLVISRANMMKVLYHFPKVDVRLREKIEKCHSYQLSPSPARKHSPSPVRNIVDISASEPETPDRSLLGQRHQQRRRARRRKGFALRWMTRPLMPGSFIAVTWDLVVVFVSTAIAWIYTYQAAFTHFNPKLGYIGSFPGAMLLAVTYVLDCVLIADILFSMKRAISTPTELVTKPRQILLRYVLSVWFVLDVLAVLPLELLSVIWIAKGEEWRYIPILRLNRLLKFWKVIAFFQNIEQSLHMSIVYMTLLKYAVYILTATHISACLWFFIACHDENSCLESSWAHSHDVPGLQSAWMISLISIYWSTATTTTVGYGDISAYNAMEMVTSMIVQLVGVMLYGYCLGSVAAILTNTATPRVSFQEKMQAARHFIREHEMGKGILKRVDHFFTLLWKQYNGQTHPGGESLLRELPQSVQEDVCMKGYGALLAGVPVFANAEPAFLRQLSVGVSLYLFAPGDIIIYDRDMGRDMYLIRKGYVEILSEDLFHIVQVLGPGNHFGEVGFLLGTPRLYTVRATTNCQLVMVKWSDVENLLPKYPHTKSELKSLSSSPGLLTAAETAVVLTSSQAMRKPKKFSCPSIRAGLAVAMATPLSVMLRSSLSRTVVACVGGKSKKEKITAPLSMKEPTGLVVRHTTAGKGGGPRRRKPRGVSKVKGQVKEKRDGKKKRGKRNSSILFTLAPCTILPNTKLHHTWEAVSVVLVLVMTITNSFQAAFLHRDRFLWTLNYFLDLYFIVDMIFNMYMAYYNKAGVLVTRPSACATHYLKTKFAIDLISSFPTDFLIFMAWTTDTSKILRVLSLARINRLLKLYKLPFAFKCLEDQITKSTGFIKVLEFFTYMSLGTHFTACVWFMVACASLSTEPYNPHTCDVESWALHYSHTPLSYFSFLHQYIVSLYWATATTTTVGYGDIRAHTHLERGYTAVIMIYGVMAYGYLIASVAASLVNADSARALHQSKLDAVKCYLKDYRVGKALRKRVTRYYECLWRWNKGVSFESLFQGIPPSLQADISVCVYKPILDKVPLFANTELGFTKLLALSIKPMLFLSNEYIVRKGDIGSEMYFIHHGCVEMVSEDGKVVFAQLSDGQYFGEVSLILGLPRTASIRATTTCDIFALRKADLYRALACYPHIEDQIQRVAKKRAVLAKVRSLIATKAAYEGRSPVEAAQEAFRRTQDEDIEGAVIYHPKGVKPKRPKQRKKRNGILRLCNWLMVFTISHKGFMGFSVYWIGCLLSYYSYFTISYQAAFQDNSWVIWVINYLCEVYFLLEIYLKFHLTYDDRKGNTVRNMNDIALHYLKTSDGFLLDLVTLFPYELIMLPVPDGHLRTTLMLYMRLPHLARIVRVRWMFHVQQERLNQNTIMLQIFKSLFLLSITTHAVACLWHFLACRGGLCHKDSWMGSTPLTEKDTSIFDHYTTSYYWAVSTMTTVGYGDLTATNVVEMMYAIVIMVGGKLMFGFILGTVASTLANLEIERVVYEDKLKALKAYLKLQSVSRDMRQRVFRFFEQLWLRHKGQGGQDVLAELPHCMRAELSLAITEPLLRSASIFRDADKAFLRQLALAMKPCPFPPGEHIIRKGDTDFGLFFLYNGEVEFLGKKRFDEGRSFGLESLLLGTPLEYSVVAITPVDAFSFSTEAFNAALRDHPQVGERINIITLNKYGVTMRRRSSSMW